jgi:hypothetical protein
MTTSTSTSFGWTSAALRVAGCFVFVSIATPFGPQVVLPEGVSAPDVPFAVMLLLGALALCMHYYLIARAYYVLSVSGIVIFALIYTLAIVNIMAFIVADSITLTEKIKLSILGFLTIFYAYGLIFNHIDSRLSGILHSKNIQ